jgi:hypothetical protein
VYISVYSSISIALSFCKNVCASAVHSGNLNNEVKLLLTTSLSPSSFLLTLATLLSLPIYFSSTKVGQFLTTIYLFPSLTFKTPCSFFLITWTTMSWSFGLTPAGTASKTEFFYKNLLPNSLKSRTLSLIALYFYSLRFKSDLESWY